MAIIPVLSFHTRTEYLTRTNIQKTTFPISRQWLRSTAWLCCRVRGWRQRPVRTGSRVHSQENAVIVV